MQFNPTQIERILREESPAQPFPPAENRELWSAIRDAAGADRTAEIIARAEAAIADDIPRLRASHFLEAKRSGERHSYEELSKKRRTMLTDLALAECLEHEGRFLDPLLDIAWAICEESTWVYPAHIFDLPNPENPVIDLFSTMTGFQLAEMLSVLGDELDPALTVRIKYEMNRRLFEPYLTRHDHWWLFPTDERKLNNWTAVCNAGVIGAAIYLEEDTARLAEIIARSLPSMEEYMKTFDRDGGSTEGPGYWGYGFGNYVLWAHMVEHRTNRRINLLDTELVGKVSHFPLKTWLSGRQYVNFSDADPEASFPVSLLALLAERLDIPDLRRLGVLDLEHHNRFRQSEITWALRNLAWGLDPDETSFVPNRHDWYSEMQWMISRYEPENPDGLVVAVKGGHNDEMHNQNDVGAIIVHVDGESVIADSGRGRYTRQYFHPDLRYTFFVNQSFAHSTPVPNSQQQGVGEHYAAKVLEHFHTEARDMLVLDLKAAYPPEADVDALRRFVAFHREAPRGWVEITDGVNFKSAPGTLESVLITFGEVEDEGEGVVILRGEKAALRVEYEVGKVAHTVEIKENVDLSKGPRDIKRVRFAFKEPIKSGMLKLKIVPV